MNPAALTDREVLVVWAWIIGRDAEWLADLLDVPVTRIRSREKELRLKLGARTKTQAAAIVFRNILGSPRRESVVVSRDAKRLNVLADAARKIIGDGVDPALALSYVVWPPECLERYAA